MADMLKYTITPSNPQAHIYSVYLRIPEPDPLGQIVSLPSWIPGSYMIRDFARNIVSINASSDNSVVTLEQLDKQTWRAAPVSQALVINYQVYAWDLSVRTAHLDTTHAYFNGSSVFLSVSGYEQKPCLVDINLPEDPNYKNWKIATSMQAVPDTLRSYRADDYMDLIDHPVEIGQFKSLRFSVHDVPHEMVLTGRMDCEFSRLETDLGKICNEHAALFGELPINRYIFLTMVVADGYGGLEHRYSSSLLCKRDDLPTHDMQQMTPDYRSFLGLCSHEYFHLWHVKRVRPQRLMEANLASEAYTELLWAFEGITSYYDDLALVRSGCIDTKNYLELFAQTITRVIRGAGRFKQSVAQSSFTAWTKFYKQDENAINSIVSYYAKGSLVAFGLDMNLRNISKDKKSLDDLMRLLWQRYGKTNIGVPEEGIEQLAAELAGESLDEYFSMAVHGTDDLPLKQWFESLGIGFRLRPAENPDDKGGCIDKPEPTRSLPVLGANFIEQGDLVRLTQVFENGAAQQTGLSAGDVLVAVNGLQANIKTLAKLIAGCEAGKPVPVHAFRRDELIECVLHPQSAPFDTCDLWLMEEVKVTPDRFRRRQAWLSSVV